MLQTMVSLIDAERTIHVQVHSGIADIAVAAITAQPVTIQQWESAMGRFVDPSVIETLQNHYQLTPPSARAEGGRVIVDMTSQLLVLDVPLPDMPLLGNVLACDMTGGLELWLPYRLPADWHMVASAAGWKKLARDRRNRLAINCHTDYRQILYGQLATSLMEAWLAPKGALEKGPRADQSAGNGSSKADLRLEPFEKLQENWLLTARDDLQGRTPRQILLAHREFIDGDVQDQGQNWVQTGRCPPGLSPKSHAFQFGGFGSHEIILYHELTALLLTECDRRMGPLADADPVADAESASTAGTGRAIDKAKEIRHLEQLQQEWLHQPHAALYEQSPAALIARERARLPAVIPEGHSEEHDDCPLCRMMRDSGEPLIWQLDPFGLDHCFATSFYPTYAQWQRANEEWETMRSKLPIDLQPAQGQQPDQSAGLSSSVWERSHTNMQFFEEMPPLEACSVMVFSIGGHMGELLQDLKPDESTVDLRRQLHELFDDLRVVLKDQEDVWMLQSAAGAFIIALNTVARHSPELALKCADLESKLDYLCRRYQEHHDPCLPND